MGLETMFAISTGLKVVGGFMQYKEQKKADKANQQAYQASIKIAQQQAALDRADADRAAQEELDQAHKAEHLQKMLYLKSGVDLNGSPLLVMEETRKKGAENAKNVKDQGYGRASLQVQSAKANKPVKRASFLNTALDTANSVAGGYSDYQLMKKQLS